MDSVTIYEIIRQTLTVTLIGSAPVLVVALGVGLAIAFFQALTQIQEITLVFVPKIIAIFMAIFFLLPSFSLIMIAYMERIADRIIGGG